MNIEYSFETSTKELECSKSTIEQPLTFWTDQWECGVDDAKEHLEELDKWGFIKLENEDYNRVSLTI